MRVPVRSIYFLILGFVARGHVPVEAVAETGRIVVAVIDRFEGGEGGGEGAG